MSLHIKTGKAQATPYPRLRGTAKRLWEQGSGPTQFCMGFSLILSVPDENWLFSKTKNVSDSSEIIQGVANLLNINQYFSLVSFAKYNQILQIP
jgi:hypothetical protein